MKLTNLRISLLAILLAALPLTLNGQTRQPGRYPVVCATCIQKNLDYLAGSDLHGRGSGTEDEHRAADYIAAQLKSYGLKPAAGNGGYIQQADISTRKVTGTPTLTFEQNTSPVTLAQGKELALITITQPEFSAPLQKLDLSDPGASATSVKPGAALLLKLKSGTTSSDVENIVGAYMGTQAALLIVPQAADGAAMFQHAAKRGPRPQRRVAGDSPHVAVILATPEAAAKLWSAPEGTPIKLHADVTPWETSHTWNVLAKIEGRKNKRQIILLSAHLDHLGVRDGKTYPGADDDGSGTVAVMELARALAKERRPQRTLVFALWGSEEQGLVGARYFLSHPTFPLQDIIANLEFEMIGRADSAVKPGELWLTGWERTDLGPTLAAHGAQLVADPHPAMSFFRRSDNFALAKDGIVAQTVSSYGLHKDYHQPTDTVQNIDWQHLDSAIGSMIAPVSWLANSGFTPQWNPGKKP